MRQGHRYGIGDRVNVRGLKLTDKITHIRWSYDADEPNKYKVGGRYWNEGNLVLVKKDKEASMSNLAMYGGFGDWKAMARQAIPTVVGGGSALAVTAACRGFGVPGSIIERHAGLFGLVAGVVVAAVSKQGGAAIGSAVVVGGGIEVLEILTGAKMVS